MPDIEAIAEPSPVPAPVRKEPKPVDLWVMLEWRDYPDMADGGFWVAGHTWRRREDALDCTIRDPRRERIVHIVEPK